MASALLILSWLSFAAFRAFVRDSRGSSLSLHIRQEVIVLVIIFPFVILNNSLKFPLPSWEGEGGGGSPPPLPPPPRRGGGGGGGGGFPPPPSPPPLRGGGVGAGLNPAPTVRFQETPGQSCKEARGHCKVPSQ